ncbi:ArsR/SmtB family transcription factor [Acidipropionibacterium virtanenii]|uniref:Arsenical resistance operon repressor n=1 Tax=Acidipropionibacterium virtanenii TaxID=2057246 RepID=A0A344UQB0_9ACTN|nr:metalloregulator ArsR/SmtB family transcription factor [Acidipropionibacterium virtanenii]AXE37458.1 Arsenical resistance operon repressor [Acidipropionibacterium virtanenii]
MVASPLPAPSSPCSSQPVELIDRPAAPSLAQIEELAAALKALADPTRLQLLRLIAAHPGASACICDLTGPLGVSQPTVSHHMKILAEAGLVTRRQEGRWAHYRMSADAVRRLGERLLSLAEPAVPVAEHCC